MGGLFGLGLGFVWCGSLGGCCGMRCWGVLLLCGGLVDASLVGCGLWLRWFFYWILCWYCGLGFSLLFFVCGLVLGTGGWLVCVDGIVWV